jgi:isopentenyldiphosphate isomerase
MLHTLYIAAFYLWIGFTAGYFFRQWLEGSLLPRYRSQCSGAGREGNGPGEQEWVDWIDEQGRVLKRVPRAEMRRRNLLHRVTATLVFHPDGRLFIQQRAGTKDVYPGLYDVCVGGTVMSGESCEENALREIAEELGIRGVPVYRLFEHRFADSHTNSLICVYACVYSGPITLQTEEVVDGFWAGRDKVEDLITAGKVCPDSAQGWRLYLGRYGDDNFARDVAPGLEPVVPGKPWSAAPTDR